MSSDRIEWVEIIEPRTKEHMYANLSTGECVWDPPVGVNVKKTDSNQWWELFDENTSRFYYYNATSQKTVWHRPHNSDIIPLAKLQTLKQNTEPVTDNNNSIVDKKNKESVATQTPGRAASRVQTAVVTSIRPIKTLDGSDSSNLIVKPSFIPRQAISCETQTSPISPRRSHHHHHHHHHHHNHSHRNQQQSASNRSVAVKNNQPVWHNKTYQSQESGRSSDSSSISGCTKSASENGAHMLKKAPLTETNSISTQHTNKTQLPVIQRSGSTASQYQTHLSKQKSFDTDISVGGGYSLGHENRGASTRSKPVIMSSSISSNAQTQISRSQSFAQQSPASNTSVPTDEEEDSMHEKYFSSNILASHIKKQQQVDSTSLVRCKQNYPEMYSPTFNTSSSNSSNTKINVVPEYVNFINPPPPPLTAFHKTASLHSRSSSSNSSTVASVSKLKMSSDKSRSDIKFSSSEELNADDDEAVNDSSSLSLSSSPPTAATPPRKLSHSKSTVIPPDNSFDKNSVVRISRPGSSHSAVSSSNQPVSYASGSNSSITQSLADKKNSTTPNSDKQIPLYSNMEFIDFQRQAQLLPLHQYILEQAKLSGCYSFNDQVAEEEEEADWSLHSEDEEHVREEYDSDEFADDEAMSNVEDDDDSSSQEYLKDEPPVFLQDDTRNSTRQRKYFLNNRICDFVDGIDESKLDESDPYYNVPPTSLDRDGGLPRKTSTQPSQHANNLVHITSGFRNISPVQHTTNSETQHASLKRRKDVPTTTSALYSPILQQTERLVSIPSQSSYFYRKDTLRRSDHAITYRDEMPHCGLNKEKKLPSESDIEKYAQDNLNIHKRGIFRKKFSVRAMLSWSKDPIRKPMLVLSDKTLKKDACDLFKLVQIYMGDRKAKIGMTLNNVALEICNIAYNKLPLRDELYIQICRQTTENPRKESLRRGWELLAICLAFFPPSPKFQPYLDSYMNRHRDPSYDFPEIGKWPIHVQVSHYATIACKRLERGGVRGKRSPKKPTLDEIDQARLQIFRPSMFGSTLQEIMDLQKERFPHYKLPWLQTTLSEQIIQLQGTQTEGIFRVPADMDEVMLLKTQLDRWEVPQDIIDAHTPASVLKLWYRELYEPLIPDTKYDSCVTHHDNADKVLAIVNELPEINRLVLAYLIRFLQMFSKSEVASVTKMDSSNLAMVMAPNCLRCTSQDPRIIFDNARKEMAFMRTLIQHMNTDFIEGVF